MANPSSFFFQLLFFFFSLHPQHLDSLHLRFAYCPLFMLSSCEHAYCKRTLCKPIPWDAFNSMNGCLIQPIALESMDIPLAEEAAFLLRRTMFLLLLPTNVNENVGTMLPSVAFPFLAASYSAMMLKAPI